MVREKRKADELKRKERWEETKKMLIIAGAIVLLAVIWKVIRMF